MSHPSSPPRRIFDCVIAALPDRAAGVRASGPSEIVGVCRHGGADALFSIISALNDDSFLPSAYELIEPSLLFALRKPNGKPRPIAIGDILDCVAGKCVLFAKRPHTMEGSGRRGGTREGTHTREGSFCGESERCREREMCVCRRRRGD